MNFEYLFKNSSRFIKEFRVNLVEGDNLVSNLKTDLYVIAISYKKIIIYYYEEYIDFLINELVNTSIKVIDNKKFELTITNKKFTSKIIDKELFTSFYNYYLKYKK